MKTKFNWAIVPATLTMVLAIAPAAFSQTARTPLSAPIVVRGTSGGSQTHDSCRGFNFSDTPTQVIQVTEPSTALRFNVEGGGQLALLITGPNNPMCIPSASGSAINVPGVWQQGTYSVYVGDRPQTSNAFTLSITQGN